MVAHPLEPHLVATGTNVGVIMWELDARSLPPIAPLPTPSESREHSALYVVERKLKLLNFQLPPTENPSFGSNASLSVAGRLKGESSELLRVKQMKKHISTPVQYASFSILSVSSSGNCLLPTGFGCNYLAIVWLDIPYFSIYKVGDWSIVDSGLARLLAWDSCRNSFAILESAPAPRIPVAPEGVSSRKAEEAAAAAAASAAYAASFQVHILLDDGISNISMKSIGSCSEPVIGLHGGALIGVACRML